MSNIFTISYDLRSPGKNYDGLYSAIQLCGNYYHALESTWYVKSDLDANGIYEKIKDEIDKNDHVVISKVDTSDQQGWMLKTFWEWTQDDSKPSVK